MTSTQSSPGRFSRRAALTTIGGAALLPAWLSGDAAAGGPGDVGLDQTDRASHGTARRQAAEPRTQAAKKLDPPPANQKPEVPKGLKADWNPARYALDTDDPNGPYGNYRLAERTARDVHWIVLHDTETDYKTTLKTFKDAESGTSAHYVVREDGHVTQMVRGRDIALHAGNWTHNIGSIGIEIVGYAEKPSKFTKAQYRAVAKLVRFLAQRYDLPLDRRHVVSHTEVPGSSAEGQGTQHFDPGPYFDWQTLGTLAGIRTGKALREPTRNSTVTIAPNLATNTVTFTGTDGKALPAQGSSSLKVHTKPSDKAPLIADKALKNGGTDRVDDWGSQAVHGQTFAVADQRRDWVGLWFGGQIGWVRATDAKDRPTLADGTTRPLVRPKSGAKVYGTNYPGAAAYEKAGIEVPTVEALPYELATDQRYVVLQRLTGADFDSQLFDGSKATWIRDRTAWLQIQLNHRTAFVRAADVTEVG